LRLDKTRGGATLTGGLIPTLVQLAPSIPKTATGVYVNNWQADIILDVIQQHANITITKLSQSLSQTRTNTDIITQVLQYTTNKTSRHLTLPATRCSYIIVRSLKIQTQSYSQYKAHLTKHHVTLL